MQYKVENIMNVEDEILTLKRIVKNLKDKIQVLESKKPSLFKRIWNKLRGR